MTRHRVLLVAAVGALVVSFSAAAGAWLAGSSSSPARVVRVHQAEVTATPTRRRPRGRRRQSRQPRSNPGLPVTMLPATRWRLPTPHWRQLHRRSHP